MLQQKRGHKSHSSALSSALLRHKEYEAVYPAARGQVEREGVKWLSNANHQQAMSGALLP